MGIAFETAIQALHNRDVANHRARQSREPLSVLRRQANETLKDFAISP